MLRTNRAAAVRVASACGAYSALAAFEELLELKTDESDQSLEHEADETADPAPLHDRFADMAGIGKVTGKLIDRCMSPRFAVAARGGIDFAARRVEELRGTLRSAQFGGIALPEKELGVIRGMLEKVAWKLGSCVFWGCSGLRYTRGDERGDAKDTAALRDIALLEAVCTAMTERGAVAEPSSSAAPPPLGSLDSWLHFAFLEALRAIQDKDGDGVKNQPYGAGVHTPDADKTAFKVMRATFELEGDQEGAPNKEAPREGGEIFGDRTFFCDFVQLINDPEAKDLRKRVTARWKAVKPVDPNERRPKQSVDRRHMGRWTPGDRGSGRPPLSAHTYLRMLLDLPQLDPLRTVQRLDRRWGTPKAASDRIIYTLWVLLFRPLIARDPVMDAMGELHQEGRPQYREIIQATGHFLDLVDTSCRWGETARYDLLDLLESAAEHILHPESSQARVPFFDLLAAMGGPDPAHTEEAGALHQVDTAGVPAPVALWPGPAVSAAAYFLAKPSHFSLERLYTFIVRYAEIRGAPLQEATQEPAQELSAFLRAVRRVVRYAPLHISAEDAEKYKAVAEAAGSLVFHQVGANVKGAIFDLVAECVARPEIDVDERILASVFATANLPNIRQELTVVESDRRCYPATLGLIRFVTVAVQPSPARPLAVDFTPYITFLCGEVLGGFHQRGYIHPHDRWAISAAAIRLLITILRSYVPSAEDVEAYTKPRPPPRP